jgi:hypothetical protein
MEVDEEGNMTSPLPSPTPAQENPVQPPAPTAPEVPVPAAAGGDSSDPGEDDEDEEEDPIQYDGYYRGGMWDDSDAEEEPLELSGGPGAPDGRDENSVNPPAPTRVARVPPEFQAEKEIHYIDEAEGPFPRMLWEAMQIIRTPEATL